MQTTGMGLILEGGFNSLYKTIWDFPGGLAVKNLPANAGDAIFIPGLESFPGGGNGSLLQCSCLENPRDEGAWGAAVYGVPQSDMTEAT